jgi:hypothetical protein
MRFAEASCNRFRYESGACSFEFVFSLDGLRFAPARDVCAVGCIRSPADPVPFHPAPAAHRPALIWGFLAELLLPCPLTFLENWLEQKGGVEPYRGGFLLHYMDKLVYPDISLTVLTVVGAMTCAFKLVLYARQQWATRR